MKIAMSAVVGETITQNLLTYNYIGKCVPLTEVTLDLTNYPYVFDGAACPAGKDVPADRCLSYIRQLRDIKGIQVDKD
jgi:hypothetical protein